MRCAAILTAAAVLFTAACAEVPATSQAGPPPVSAQGARPAPAVAAASGPAAYALPDPLATRMTFMPIDAIRIASAIVDRLGGGTGAAAGVRFAAQAAETVDESGLGFDGFEWRDSALYQYAVRDDGRAAAGRLDYVDGLGRQASLLFTAEYSIEEPIEITEVRIAPLYVLDPAVAVYLLDAAALTRAGAGVTESHAALLQYASANALAPVVGGNRNVVVAAFLLEPVSPSATFDLRISATPEGGGGFAETAHYLSDGPWRAAVLPGNLAAGAPPVYAKARFVPGAEIRAPDRTPVMLGVYGLNVAAPAAGG